MLDTQDVNRIRTLAVNALRAFTEFELGLLQTGYAVSREQALDFAQLIARPDPTKATPKVTPKKVAKHHRSTAPADLNLSADDLEFLRSMPPSAKFATKQLQRPRGMTPGAVILCLRKLNLLGYIKRVETLTNGTSIWRRTQKRLPG